MAELRATLIQEIGRLKRPVVTGYQIGVILFALYRDKKNQNLTKLKKLLPTSADYHRQVSGLVDDHVLTKIPAFGRFEVFNLIGHSVPSAEELVTLVDPFCFISHLSAMEYHGFTDRLPTVLFLTSPSPEKWKSLAAEKMTQDLGDELQDYLQSRLPTLRRPKLANLRKPKIVRVYQSERYSPSEYLSIDSGRLRVATVGRTFIDMLRNPELCGGMSHVMSVFEREAEIHLAAIEREIERYGAPIDKVRAGYILTEKLQLESPIAQSWERFAQRGGSRKLDASGPYSSNFSERWCLSLNVD